MVILLCAGHAACAQTFLQRLQSPKNNQGTISVTEDVAIDKLVNGPGIPTANGAERPSAPTSGGKTKEEVATTAQPDKQTATAVEEEETTETDDDYFTYDSRKKVMVNSYKTDGYRVQAYAGGNTKKDKIKAEEAGSKIKRLLPDQPVYVHFYSPRWICRVGNFRSYEEAHQVLLLLREEGFKQATIVKGKITVQY